MKKLLTVLIASLSVTASVSLGNPDDPTAQSLIERHRKENSPVWADGDTVTFFFQGDAEQVSLMFCGEQFPFRRIADSDVWIAT
jgi:hypothetical protein